MTNDKTVNVTLTVRQLQLIRLALATGCKYAEREKEFYTTPSDKFKADELIKDYREIERMLYHEMMDSLDLPIKTN